MKKIGILLGALGIGIKGIAKELTIGDLAPIFQTKTHENKEFNLSDRKGQWTVLYFYPKAETPGCTKQACSFRDSIKKIRELGGEVYGISSDDVEDLSKFHAHHKLNFPLLADPKSSIINLFDVKMPILSMAKRTTFILDPELKVRYIDKNVDPVKDADNVSKKILELKGK